MVCGYCKFNHLNIYDYSNRKAEGLQDLHVEMYIIGGRYHNNAACILALSICIIWFDIESSESFPLHCGYSHCSALVYYLPSNCVDDYTLNTDSLHIMSAMDVQPMLHMSLLYLLLHTYKQHTEHRQRCLLQAWKDYREKMHELLLHMWK